MCRNRPRNCREAADWGCATVRSSNGACRADWVAETGVACTFSSRQAAAANNAAYGCIFEQSENREFLGKYWHLRKRLQTLQEDQSGAPVPGRKEGCWRCWLAELPTVWWMIFSFFGGNAGGQKLVSCNLQKENNEDVSWIWIRKRARGKKRMIILVGESSFLNVIRVVYPNSALKVGCLSH